jgi:predicted nuclease of predicted toxin-antitoxin system
MIFLLDHDVPDAIARIILQAGHGSHRLRELLPRDADDRSVLAFALSRQAVVVSCNRDHFLKLAESQPHSGIVILIRRRTRIAECSHFLRLLEKTGETGLRNNINFV